MATPPDPGSSPPADAALHAGLAVVLALVGPAVLGLATSAVGESTLTGVAVLWGEPLLLLLGVHLALWMLWEHRFGVALATLVGFGIGGLALRRPPAPEPVQDLAPDWAARMRACAAQPADSQAPLRLLSWTLDPARPTPSMAALADQNADIYVIQGLAAPDRAELLAGRLGGEALYLPSGEARLGMALVVRGRFQRCGGDESSWALPLGAPGAGGRAVLTFPEVEGVGVVPLIGVRMPRPGPLGQWRDWPGALHQGAQRVAALARSLGGGRVLLAGDFGVPRTFRSLAGALRGAGLVEADAPPTWPHRLGGLPGLPLHALERTWTGADWTATTSQAVDIGDQPRRPLVTELVPRTGRAGRP